MKSNVMPDGWVSLVAADSFDQISTLGKSIKTKDCSSSGKYPVVDQGQELITGYIDDLSRVVEVESPIVLFGDHTRAVKWIDFNFVPGADGTKLLKPKIFINNRFSYYQLKSLDIPDKGYARHFKYLKELSFVIPPLAEQQVIADKLDTLLAQVESIRARLEHIPETLKQFRQSVLAAAVTGKLMECNEEVVLKKLAEVGVQIKTGPFGSALHKSDYIEDGVPVINPMHINNGVISPSKSMTISKEKFIELDVWKLRDEDIVLGRRGEMGRAAIVKTNGEDLLCGTGSMIVRVDKNNSPKYIEFVLRSPVAVNYFNSSSVGTTMVNLNQKIIKELEVFLPSLQTQLSIVELVENYMEKLSQIEQQAQSALNRVNNLTQSILAKAFRGELTAEWREAHSELISGENSAEALLERIKAERSIKSVTKRGRGKS